MRKKLAVLGIAFVMLFTFAAAGCGGDPNRGRIKGLDGGEFVAHHGRGVNFFPFQGEHRNHVTKVISSRNELVEWLEMTTLEWIEWVDRQDWTDWEGKPELSDYNPYNDEILAVYCDYFFELRQLIFINFLGSRLDYEAERITYQDSVLSIGFMTTTIVRGFWGQEYIRLSLK